MNQIKEANIRYSISYKRGLIKKAKKEIAIWQRKILKHQKVVGKLNKELREG